ncbi:tRNA (adenosine(37)-N6)-threonylcarbamoyltransferase complex dimerization subunit type 1 TsaB [Pollutibacter soli]|uniref:tRNA (adenosine(37)-N6)-threonylcarbamoyltransferase complex dimerization subunit type 1 TsaB n=1 Tax=Pollutibacter soli TaxID=3034157 RepID=UPI003013E8FD
MNTILHINTALETAYVAVSDNDQVLDEIINPDQKTHAAFLHPAIKEVLGRTGIPIAQLKAVSVIIGPGSYTGLRVGLAAAKGICFAMNIPLLTVNSLEWMAYSQRGNDFDFLCPMIDARRNEVFTAVFNKNWVELRPPHALILENGQFDKELETGKTLFFGNGAEKAKSFFCHRNSRFLVSNSATSNDQYHISMTRYLAGNFAELAYSEPLYTKEFYTSAGKKPHN